MQNVAVRDVLWGSREGRKARGGKREGGGKEEGREGALEKELRDDTQTRPGEHKADSGGDGAT